MIIGTGVASTLGTRALTCLPPSGGLPLTAVPRLAWADPGECSNSTLLRTGMAQRCFRSLHPDLRPQVVGSNRTAAPTSLGIHRDPRIPKDHFTGSRSPATTFADLLCLSTAPA